MLRKIVFTLVILFLLTPRGVFAKENFTTSTNVEYKVQDDGITWVTHTVRIKNNTTEEFTKAYRLTLFHLNPNNVRAYEGGNPVPIVTDSEDGVYKITLNFESAVVGKDSARVFVVTYEEDSLVNKSGEVWEIAVPKPEIALNSQNYNVQLSVPNDFGEEAIVSPEPNERKKTESRNVYSFDGGQLEKSGITAAFGKFQVFSVSLAYHLKNDTNRKSSQSVAIPPDVSTQRVFYENISPAPKNITVDEDGNWLATFEIQPKKKVDVKVKGFVQVFAKPLKFLTPYPDTLLENLKPQEYWETDDPAIKRLASELKNPKAIYDFVVTYLKYNYDRVKPDVARAGASKALLSPNEAICMEFTDLFIAISRAAGIPAREINGYAYSDNFNLQPLSLVADVLHAWPEYWDETEQVWVPVDPTWEATSKIDYFDKFDLKHLAFVIHGTDSKSPLPAGSYRADDASEKDVHVEFSSLPEELKGGIIEIDYELIKSLNIFDKNILIKFRNTGSSALYNITPKISYNGKEVGRSTIQQLVPYEFHEVNIKIPVGLFATKLPNSILISAQNTKREIFLEKYNFIIQQLLAIFLTLLAILAFFGVKTKKLTMNTLRRVISKFHKSEAS
jgi:hypothetical protein